MGAIIKAAQAVFLPRWQPDGIMDLTRPGAGVSQAEREALGVAANIIAAKASGKLVFLAEYRLRRLRGSEGGPAA